MISVHHGSVDGIRLAEKLVRLLDISGIQLFPHIRTADIPVVILFLVDDDELVPVFRLPFFEAVRIAGPLIAKGAVRSDDDHPGVHARNQDIPHEVLRRHTCRLLRKRILH